MMRVRRPIHRPTSLRPSISCQLLRRCRRQGLQHHGSVPAADAARHPASPAAAGSRW
jgi:hypothetical protein